MASPDSPPPADAHGAWRIELRLTTRSHTAAMLSSPSLIPAGMFGENCTAWHTPGTGPFLPL